MQTKIFMQSLKKMEPPLNAKTSQQDRDIGNIDWSKIGEIINIKQRLTAMRDLTNVLQRQNQQKKEAKAVKKMMHHKQKMMQRNPNYNYNAVGHAQRSESPDRKYSVFSEESSSVSGEFDNIEAQQNESLSSNGRFQYPSCLSSIILRLKDILLNPLIIENIKVEYKAEIIRLIQLCLQEQKCLIYKMPFFVLNFLTSSSLTNQYSRLDFLKMITKNGRVLNKAFNSKMFLVLINMIDSDKIKDPGANTQNQHAILEFLKTLFEFNPDCFNVSQTLILLTRVCLVGFTAMNNCPELSYEMLQILQFLLKYNKFSSTHNLKNLALLALTIMATKDGMTELAWYLIRDLIFMDPDRIVYEILEILMIGNNTNSIGRLSFQNSEAQRQVQTSRDVDLSPPSKQQLQKEEIRFGLRQLNIDPMNSAQRGHSEQSNRQSQNLDLQPIKTQSKDMRDQNTTKLKKNEKKFDGKKVHVEAVSEEISIQRELYIKCFNQQRDEFVLDLDEIDNEINSKHKSSLINNFEEIDANLSVDELICKMECPSNFIDIHQSQHIIEFDSRQQKMFREDKLKKMKKKLDQDRHEFIEQLEKHIERVKRGAVYFLGMTLYGNERVKECSYSISRILEVFRTVLTSTKNFKLINEIIQSILTLLQNQTIQLTFEWDLILDIVETLYKYHSKELMKNKKLGHIDQIFKNARDQIILGKYRSEEVRVFKLYVGVRQKYMSSKIFRDLELQFQNSKLADGARKNKLREQYAIPLPNIVLLSLYMDHVLYEEFHNVEIMVTQLFLNETNIDVKQLLLDKMHDFYKDSLGSTLQKEKIETTLVQAFEVVFNHKSQQSFMVFSDENHQNQEKPKDNSSNQNLNIQLKAIDILAFMIHKTSDEKAFRVMVNLISGTIKTQNFLQDPSMNQKSNSNNKFQQNQSLFKEMNSLQKLSITRLVQIFKLKCKSLECYKSVFVLNILLEIFIHETIDKRQIIYDEILQNFKINKQGDLCWLFKDCPLMFGLQEYHKINMCQICNPQLQNDKDQLIELQMQGKMVISLQNLLESFLIQQALGEGSILNFKLDCLKMIKNLIFDIFSSEDQLHQSQTQHSGQTKIDLNHVISQLLRFIDIDNNFDCSKLILEIIHMVIGSQNYKNEQQINCSPSTHYEIFSKLILSVRQSFSKYYYKKDGDLERKTMKAKITQIFLNDCNSMGMSFENVEEEKEKETARLGRTTMGFSRANQNLSQIPQYFDKKNFDQSTGLQEARNVIEPAEYLEVCQTSISLIGFALQSDCRKIFSAEPIDDNQTANSFNNQQSPNQSTKLIKQIMELCYEIIRNDQTINHVTFQVLYVLKGITMQLIDRWIHDQQVIEFVQFLLFRIAMPKMIVMNESFGTICQKAQNKNNSQFLKRILMDSIKQVDTNTNIFSYQESPQLQMLLDKITSIQLNLFDIFNEFEVFEVLQNFFAKIHAQFEWHHSQSINHKVGFQQMFISNMIDLLQWCQNTQQGRLKRHLEFKPNYKSSDMQFYVLNQSLIQVCKCNEGKNKFIVYVRNSAYNTKTIYQIENPQQSELSNTPLSNKEMMRQLMKNNTPEAKDKEINPEIDQKILFQLINPIIMNDMKKQLALFKVEPKHHNKCVQMCEKLDKLPPYNMNIVFVSSYYTDKETALDILSQLGNFTSLKEYMHYFVDQNEETVSYLQTLHGVVFDKHLTDIFVFISDIFGKNINYKYLLGIKNLQTLFLGSVAPLASNTEEQLHNEQLQAMHEFLRFQMRQCGVIMPPLKIFQLNSRAYIVSEKEVACGHVVDGAQHLCNDEDQVDILQKILNNDNKEDGESGSIDVMLRESEEYGQHQAVHKKATIYRKKNIGPSMYESQPYMEDRDQQVSRSVINSFRDPSGSILQYDKVERNSVAFSTFDNHLYRSPDPKATKNTYDSTSSGLERESSSGGLQNLGWSAVSQILQVVPEFPIYDRMVVPREFVGQHIRQCLQERWMCNQQYNKNFRSPNMLARYTRLQGLIYEIKETLPSNDK